MAISPSCKKVVLLLLGEMKELPGQILLKDSVSTLLGRRIFLPPAVGAVCQLLQQTAASVVLWETTCVLTQQQHFCWGCTQPQAS